MDTAVRHRIMRIEDFLAWEHRQEFRFEFDGFEPVARAGGSLRHAAIQHNVNVALGVRLRGKPCRLYGSDLKVLMADRVRYPDGQVVCSQIDGAATFSMFPSCCSKSSARVRLQRTTRSSGSSTRRSRP